MAVWSKTLLLTATCLSILHGIDTHPGQVRRLPVTLGEGVVFAGYYNFHHQVKLAGHDCNMAEKGTKKGSKFNPFECNTMCISGRPFPTNYIFYLKGVVLEAVDLP